MWSSRNSHLLLMGVQNGPATVKGSWADSYKTKLTLTYNPAIVLLGVYTKELKTCSHKILHTHVYISFTHKQYLDRQWDIIQ